MGGPGAVCYLKVKAMNQNPPQTKIPQEQLTPASRDSSIGRILLDMGKLSPEDAERVLRLQKESGLRFGDVAQQLGLITESDIRQVLAMQFDYPYLQPGQGNLEPELVAAYQPFSAEVEALRALRSQLMLRWFSEGHRALGVVSANSGDGCSYLAANLAVVFSQLGEHTLLVDANMREPRQKSIFKLNQSLGLSDILAGRASMDVITRIDSLVDLSVLGAGTIPPNPQELLGRNTFTDFMNQAIGIYDVIIIDTPPVLQTSDAQIIAARCGGVVMASRLNQTRLADVEVVLRQIDLTGAQMVGAVINDY